MATYTDNYQLTKPTYAEQADIGVVNSNMNIIDDIMHSSQVSLAPAYDQSQTYAEGDVVMYELLMYKCISPTAGVWDGSKWERTTASESGGGGSAELDILGEGNGAVVSFSDGASAELAKCIADINPVQDLHGYDKPWAGGAGKNKCPFNITDIKARNADGTWTGNNYAINNVVVSVLTDTDGNITGFKYNGTANSAFSFNLTASNLTLPSGSYIWSIQETVDKDGLWVSIYNPNTVAIVAKTQTAVNYTCNGSFGGAYIYTNGGNTFDNVVFRPMLRLSSEADASFEPYSNICPISGHSSVKINVSPTSDPSQGLNVIIQLGNTYYGGILNVLTGELTIDRYMVVLDGVNKTVSVSATTNPNGRTVLYGAEVNTVDIYRAKSLCDKLQWSNSEHAYLSLSEYTATVASGGASMTVRFVLPISDSATTAEANTYLQSNNYTFVFPLATPQTVQLTPQEVNSLLGQNNISADTGDIDIVYVKASAPIQPNPTGTPTATLKKLGIEGTVFEVPSGGGGSSSGINYSTTEHPIGTDEDDKTIYEKTWKLSSTINISSSGVNLPSEVNSDLLSVGAIPIKGHARRLAPSPACVDLAIYMSSTSQYNALCVDNWGDISRITIQYTKATD
jgi:hypothetical protein